MMPDRVRVTTANMNRKIVLYMILILFLVGRNIIIGASKIGMPNIDAIKPILALMRTVI